MIFTFIQLLIMFITVYLCVYSLIDRVLKCSESIRKIPRGGNYDKNGSR